MDLNDELFQRAQISIPGGVNSPVRAFRSVGGSPRFIDRAKGPYMWDATGKQFIDYILSWGPMILGHNNDEVIAAVDEAVSKGLSFGAVTQGETLIAEEVRKLVPSMDQVRLVSSGTEAGMSAIRLARGYTGRNKIIKFEGCYHGHRLSPRQGGLRHAHLRQSVLGRCSRLRDGAHARARVQQPAAA